MTHLSVDLVLTMEIFFDKEKHYLYHLVSRYCNLAFCRIYFEQEAQKSIICLKWLFMLDCLASESPPVLFPLAPTLLRDDQWIPGGHQWEDLSPPWDLAFGFSTKKKPNSVLEVK